MGWEKCVWKISYFDEKLSSLDLKHCTRFNTKIAISRKNSYSNCISCEFTEKVIWMHLASKLSNIFHIVYSHGQELFYKFVSKFTDKLVKKLLSMTLLYLYDNRIHLLDSIETMDATFGNWTTLISDLVLKIRFRVLVHSILYVCMYVHTYIKILHGSSSWNKDYSTMHCM